jgi:hypothetical protein
MKRVFASLFSVVLSITLLEIGLRIVDPWGAFAYYADMWTLRQHYVPVADARVYTLPPGAIALRGWTATITKVGRAVPSSGVGACELAFVGDSYTFGHGVQDANTFANQVAKQFPDIQIINLGENGYNTAQVVSTVQHSDADGYVYLIICNDAEPAMSEMLHPEPMTAIQGLRVYNYYLQRDWRKRHTVQAQTELAEIPQWFNQSIAALAARDDVLMVAFEHDILGGYIASRYPQVVTIPRAGHPNSKADGHPNAIGHERIAYHLIPYVSNFIHQICEGDV